MTWLDEVKSRCKAATAGPWEHHPDAAGGEADPALVGVGYDGGPIPITTGTAFWSMSDFDFIAHARTDLPRALALLERATELLELTVGLLNCQYDGECRGCALESTIDLFLKEVER